MRVRIVTKRIVVLSPEHAPVTFSSHAQRRFSERQVRTSIFRILRGNVLCTISTVNRNNQAYINTAYFCSSENLELYFLSDPGSLHCRNLSTNSSMAIAIFSSSQKWNGPGRGIQLFGTCREARGLQATKAEWLYGKRFPAYGKWKAASPPQAGSKSRRIRDKGKDDQSRVFRYRFYRFIPNKVKILDEKEFGSGVFVIAAVKRTRGVQ